MSNMTRQTLSRFGLKGGGVDACEGQLSDGAPTHVKRDQAAEQVNGAISSTTHGAETRGSGHMHGHDSATFERNTGGDMGVDAGNNVGTAGGSRDTTDDRDMLRAMRDRAHADQGHAPVHDSTVAQHSTSHGDRTAGTHQTGKDVKAAEESMYHMTEDQLKFAREEVDVRPHPHMTLEKGVGSVDDAKADTTKTTGGLKGGNPYHHFGTTPGAGYGYRGLRGGSDDKSARTNTKANVGGKDAHARQDAGEVEGEYHMTEDQLKFAKEKVEVRPHPHMTLDKNVGSADDAKTDTSKASGGLRGGNPYYNFGRTTGGAYGGRGLRGGSDDKSAQTRTNANAAAGKATSKDAHTSQDAAEVEGAYHMTEDQLKFAKERVEVRPHPHMTLDKNIGESADDAKADTGKASGGLKGGNPYHHFGHMARGAGHAGHGLRGGSDDKSARTNTKANVGGKDAHVCGDSGEGGYHMTEDQLKFAKEKVEVRPHPHMTLDKNVGSADDVKADTSKASGGLKGGGYTHFGHTTGGVYGSRGLRGGSEESKQAQQTGQKPGRHDAHVCGEGTGPYYHMDETDLGHRKEQIGVAAHPHMPLHADADAQSAPPDRDASKPSKGQLTAVADPSAGAGAGAKTLFDQDSGKPGRQGSTTAAHAPVQSQSSAGAADTGDHAGHQQAVPKPTTERKPSTAAATAGAGAAALRQAARVGTAPTQTVAPQPSTDTAGRHDSHATHQHLDVGAGTTGVSKASLNAITGDVNDTFFDTGAGKSVGSALNEDVAESSFSAARTAGDDMGVDTDALHREGDDDEHRGGMGGTGATHNETSTQSTLITEDTLKNRPPRSRGTRLEVDRGEEGRGFDPVQRNIPQPHYSSFRDAQRAEAEGAGVDSGERWDSGRGTSTGRSSGTSGKSGQMPIHTHARTRGAGAAQRERMRGREEKYDTESRIASHGVSGRGMGTGPSMGRTRRRRGVPRDTTRASTHIAAASRQGVGRAGNVVSADAAGGHHARVDDSGLRVSARDPNDHFRDVGVSVRGDDGIGGADADYRRVQCTLEQCLKHRGLAAYSMPSTRGGAEMSVGHNAAQWRGAFGSRGMALLLGRLAGEDTGQHARQRGPAKTAGESSAGSEAGEAPISDPDVVVEHSGGSHMDASDTFVTTGAGRMPSAETSAVDTRGVVDEGAGARETDTPHIHGGRLVGARDRRLNMFETRRTSSDRSAREGFLPVWHRENSAGEDRVGPITAPVAADSLSPTVVSGVAPSTAPPPPTATPATATSPKQARAPSLSPLASSAAVAPAPATQTPPVATTDATIVDTNTLEQRVAALEERVTALEGVAAARITQAPVVATSRVAPPDAPFATVLTAKTQDKEAGDAAADGSRVYTAAALDEETEVEVEEEVEEARQALEGLHVSDEEGDGADMAPVQTSKQIITQDEEKQHMRSGKA